MSADVIWSLVKNNNAFLIKRNGVQLSREPGNLTNCNSFSSSGLANCRAVQIAALPKGAGVSVAVKSRSGARKPAKAYKRYTLDKLDLKRAFRPVARLIKSETVKRHYRSDLTQVALARWTLVHRALLRQKGILKSSQKTRPKRRTTKAKKAAAVAPVAK